MKLYRVSKGNRPGTFGLTLLDVNMSFLLDGPGLDEVTAFLKEHGWGEVQ
jgi:hypothetical protein